MSERLTTAEGLEPGDVVTVAIELPDKQRRGQTYWWTRFAVVTEQGWKEHVMVLTLKMHPDLEKDVRAVDVTRDVVIKLPPERWPQGVIAMRMKAIALGWVTLGGV